MSSLIIPDRARRVPTDAPRIAAGQWWEYRGDPGSAPSFGLRPGAIAPESPLTLLVTDVRIHDGEIHSVHLARHPSWEEPDRYAREGREVRVLADRFLLDFVEVDAAEASARREREMSRLMEAIGAVQRRISAGPSPREIEPLALAIGEKERKAAYDTWRQARMNEIWRKEPHDLDRRRALIEALPDHVPEEGGDAADRRVPAALLPGGNVAAAKREVETQILGMRATQAWITRRTEEMTASMSVIGAFQSEKVGAITASISSEVRRAESLLQNVQTMDLFLGKGCGLHVAATGRSAAPTEPLRFLQRMLYLDEEMFVHGRFAEGFNGDDVTDLPELLRGHPELVRRMMPYERCAVIVRARRHDRPFEFAAGDAGFMLNQVFEKIRQQEADARVMVLIRDGENVRIVIADEQTSQATRLFPSAREIDQIYAGKSGEIGVNDIEYSDRRNAHDSRALFYKRFLIMFWGLHERESAFGDFMPKGENWLLQSVASERFAFVHDEESVIDDDLPNVQAFIARMNRGVTAGSTVVVDTSQAFDETTAPTAYSKRDRTHDRGGPLRERHPVSRILLQKVSKRGSTLSVPVETRKGYSDDEKSARNTPMTVLSDRNRLTDGVLCIDDLSSADILRYMGSRKARQSYLSWINLFAHAFTAVREREAREAELIARVSSHGPKGVRTAMSVVRRNKRGADTLDASDAGKVLAIARKVREASSAKGGPVIIDRGGKLWTINPPEPVRDVTPAWVLRAPVGGGASQVCAALMSPVQGDQILRGHEEMFTLLKNVRETALPGFTRPEDVAALDRIDTDAALAIVRGDRDVLGGALAADAFHLFRTWRTPDGMVNRPFLKLPLGVATLGAETAGPDGNRARPMTRVFYLRVDLIMALAANGHMEEAAALTSQRYGQPRYRLDRLGGAWCDVTYHTERGESWERGIFDCAPMSEMIPERQEIVMSSDMDVNERPRFETDASDLGLMTHISSGRKLPAEQAEAATRSAAERGRFHGDRNAEEVAALIVRLLGKVPAPAPDLGPRL